MAQQLIRAVHMFKKIKERTKAGRLILTDFHGIWLVIFFWSWIWKFGAFISPLPLHLFTNGFFTIYLGLLLVKSTLLCLLVAYFIYFYSTEMNFYRLGEYVKPCKTYYQLYGEFLCFLKPKEYQFTDQCNNVLVFVLFNIICLCIMK